MRFSSPSSRKNRTLVSFNAISTSTAERRLKQNRRRHVIAVAAFSDELQRRFVEEIPRLRLGEGLCDLLQTLDVVDDSPFVLMLSFHFADARCQVKNNAGIMISNIAYFANIEYIAKILKWNYITGIIL